MPKPGKHDPLYPLLLLSLSEKLLSFLNRREVLVNTRVPGPKLTCVCPSWPRPNSLFFLFYTLAFFIRWRFSSFFSRFTVEKMLSFVSAGRCRETRISGPKVTLCPSSWPRPNSSFVIILR